MDIYFEKNIINNKTQSSPALTTIPYIIRIICIAVLVVGMIVLLSVLEWSYAGALFNIFIFICLICPTVGGILICTKILNNNCEYDYFISEGQLKIIKIINQKKRVEVVITELYNVTKVGLTETDEYNKIDKNECKVVKAYANHQEDYLYIVCTYKSKNYVVLCEYDDDFINALKVSIPTFGAFDSSLRKEVKQ